MITDFNPTVFHFPSENVIITYLEQHSSTNKEKNPCFSEEKIIQTVAKVFANRGFCMREFPMGVLLMIV